MKPNVRKGKSSSGSSSTSSLAAASSSSEKKKTKTTAQQKQPPKSVLDKLIYAIRNQPPGTNGGVSRVNLTKYLKSEFDYENSTQIKLALKRGVSKGILVQTGQSFCVKGDPSRLVDESQPQLQIEDVLPKKGSKEQGEEDDSKKSSVGDTVTVQYVGTLEDGTKFDSAKSFSFTLGGGEVIKGWDQGLVGMAIGSKRKLVVPSRLGYGKRGCAPDIPPNATLYFTVTMKKIKPG